MTPALTLLTRRLAVALAALGTGYAVGQYDDAPAHTDPHTLTAQPDAYQAALVEACGYLSWALILAGCWLALRAGVGWGPSGSRSPHRPVDAGPPA